MHRGVPRRGVASDDAILDARLGYAKAIGLPLSKRILAAAVADPRRTEALVKAVRAMQSALDRAGIAADSGLRVRLAALVERGAGGRAPTGRAVPDRAPNADRSGERRRRRLPRDAARPTCNRRSSRSRGSG